MTSRLQLTPAPCTDDVDADMLAERRRRLVLYRAAAQDTGLRAYLYKRASVDPVFWFGNFAWTQVKWRTQRQLKLHGTKRQPALLWPFVEEGMRLFLGLDGANRTPDDELYRVVHAKSREVGGTKNITLFAVWDWQFNEDGDYGFISRAQAEVDNNQQHGGKSIFSFIRWAVRQQPPWLRPTSFQLQTRSRNEDNYLEIINPRFGTSLVGSSTVVDAMRGDRRKRVVIDEANSFKHYAELLESLADVGPTWSVSSVKGTSTGFARACHGRLGFDVHPYGQHVGKRGWVYLRWHYSDRPDRRPGTEAGDRWIAGAKAGRSPEQWAQEQEISFVASMPSRIWDNYNEAEHLYTGDEWREDVVPYLSSATLIEAWDFGSGAALTAVVWAAYFESTDQLFVLDYRQWQHATHEQVAADVAAAGWYCNQNPSGRRPDKRIGDIAGSQRGARMQGGRRINHRRSWIENLRDHGIRIRGSQLPVEDAIARVRSALGSMGEEPQLYFSPLCARIHTKGLPSLVECVSQYHRVGTDDPNAFVGDAQKPEKDVNSHAADALQHIVWCVWPRMRTACTTTR